MLSQQGYKERADLQQWIISNPEIIEPGLLILTDEYDRWADAHGRSVRDRLDILALDPAGRLVVLELKRDDAPPTVDLAYWYRRSSASMTVRSALWTSAAGSRSERRSGRWKHHGT